jgi:tetratricopeptide (TPR) repeat protein
MNTLTTPEAAADLRQNLRAMRPEQGLSPESQERAYAMGFGWLQIGDFEKAQFAFQTLWQCCPDEARYAAGMGHSALGLGQTDLALSYFLLAVGLEEDNPGYMLGLGRAFVAGDLPGHGMLALKIAQSMAEAAQDRQTAEMAGAFLRLMDKSA